MSDELCGARDETTGFARFSLPVLALPKASSSGLTTMIFSSRSVLPALHSSMMWLTSSLVDSVLPAPDSPLR